MSDATADELAETIEQASEASIVADLADGSGWQFRHALIREALYERIVSMRRRSWHRRVAEALATSGHPDPDTVAYHFQQANDDRATDWLIRAGERAASLYASKVAVERLEAALPALEADGNDRLRGWIMWLLGEQLGYIDPLRATAHFDEAERLGLMIADSLLVAHARLFRGFGLNLYQQGFRAGLSDVTSGVDLLDQIVETAVEPPPIYVRDWSHPNTHRAFRAMIRAVVGDLDAALDDIAEYVPGAPNENVDRRVDIRPTTTIAATGQMGSARAYLAFGRVRAMQGIPAESAQAFEQALLLTAQTNDDGMLALSYMNWLAYLTLPYFADVMELRRNMLERHDQAWSRAVDKLGIGPMPEGVSHLLTAYLDGAWSEMDWMDGWWHEQMATSTLSWGIVEEVVFARRAHARGEFERAWREICHVLSEGPASEPGDRIFRGAEELQRLAVELALDEGNSSQRP